MLSPDQALAYDEAMKGNNIFLTGSAGVGKSYTLEMICSGLRDRRKKVVLTASTGIAALNIGGRTLHSYSRLGLATDSKDVLLQKSKRRPGCWRYIDVLIIDEISMLSADFFEKVEYVARMTRNPSKMFGGIQVIAVGDFCQLPPINGSFCFKTEAWENCRFFTVQLTTVHRQSNVAFVNVLEKVRRGIIDHEVTEMLQSRVGVKLDTSNGIEPSFLFPLRRQVETINNKRLEMIPGDPIIFEPKIKVSRKDEDVPEFLVKNATDSITKNIQCDPILPLKVGAQVLLVINLSPETGLVNGSRGVVTSVDKYGPVVLFESSISGPINMETYTWNQKEPWGNVELTQFPLRLAWAVTIHKSQGMSLDKTKIDLSDGIFADGQAYVALSRVRSLEGLTITRFVESSVRANAEVKAFYS
jgi:ATP-dependent DNA helicase PIF1